MDILHGGVIVTEEIKKEGNIVSFDMTIPSDRIEEAMTAVFNKEKHQFQLPGFRKGKVPRRLLESSYGEDLFFEDFLLKYQYVFTSNAF